MATVSQILEIEDGNTDSIHLFRVGLFYRAFQRSAYMFQANLRNFRAVKKHYKATGCDLVMLGFPSAMLAEILPDAEDPGNGHVKVEAPAIFEMEKYQAWFAAVEPARGKKREAKHPAPPARTAQVEPAPFPAPPMPELQLFPPPEPSGGRVLRELETFPIESATPLECMIFLSKLKSELKRGGANGCL